MFNLFKRGQEKPTKKKQWFRSFIGARPTAMAKFATTYAKINSELRSDSIALTLRARDLAKNSAEIASYINIMVRNVIGAPGFTLSATTYNDDGTPDRMANKIIENAWWDYGHSYEKFVSADEQMNEREFDEAILRCLLVDGEVFIRKIKDSKSKYGVRWKIIDALDVDTLYNVEYGKGARVCMGIKVDENLKPISYFIRKNRNLDYYTSGEREEVPASEIVHIYKRQFAEQIRGYTPLAPVLVKMASLSAYNDAELNAAILESFMMGMYEKTGNGDAYSQYDDGEIDNDGNIATELETNTFRFCPEGYSFKQIQSNHPHNGFSEFVKATMRSIASAIGISTNRLTSNFESANFSSLKAAFLEDTNTYREMQMFLIEGWKDRQYLEWLKQFLLSDLSNLPFSKFSKFVMHQFRGRSWETLEPIKDVQAIQLRLQLGITDPITEIEALGGDVDDTLDRIVLWREKLKARGLKVNDVDTIVPIDDGEEVDENTVDGEGKIEE